MCSVPPEVWKDKATLSDLQKAGLATIVTILAAIAVVMLVFL